MTKLLQEKRLATKFQILVEMASSQPYVQQKAIANKVDISTQAVAQYIKEMAADGWIHKNGRYNNRITKEGVDWLLKSLRDMNVYLYRADKIARNMSVCAAVAGCDLVKGQKVGLVMEGGRLIATEYRQLGAMGVVVVDARTGQDVGISSIAGIVKLAAGKVTIMSIPGIIKGGSRNVDYGRIKEAIAGNAIIGAIGIEAVIALKNIGITPHYLHGVKESAIEAAQCGLSTMIACVSNEVPLLTQALEDKLIEYRVLDMKIPE